MRAITEFSPGDEVIIRDWEDMEDEYGTNEIGNIECRYTFVREMRRFCGERHVIHEISKLGTVFLKGSSMLGYNISTDMIRRVDDPEYATDEISEPDADRLFSLLI